MKEQFLLSGDHPILSNHKVFGQELLPGPAYVDLIYQAFRDNGYDWRELELCHVSIYHPLAVGHDYEVLIDIVVEEKEAGCWSIVVEGRESRDGAVSPEAKRYADAQMRKIQPVSFDKTINLGQAINQAEASVDLEEAYAQFRALGLIHTGMMKAEGHTFQTSTGVLIELALDRNSRDSAEDVLFHPTLLDASCVGASLLLRALVGEEQQLFLPLYFESFRAEQLIQERCYTQVLTPSVQRKNELLSMTLELFDSKGHKVAEMKNYTMKLVRAASGISSSAVSGDGDDPSVTEPAPAPVKQGHALSGERTPTVQAAAFLTGILAERLNMAEADLDRNAGYYEMGLDSPGLLEMVKKIEAKVGAVLPPTLLFEYTTIADLSVYLAEQYASAFADESFAPVPGDGINAPRLQLDERPDNRKKPADSSNRSEASTSQEEDIAIIGMSGRFPGASDLREFWQNLKDGKDCISEIPPSRWDWKQFEDLKSPSGKGVSRWGGFIDDPDCFDAPFFRISPREAEIIDPQERIFLETCWEAIEDAGYRPSSLVTPRGPNKRNLVGVFAGVMHKDYALLGSELMAQGLLFPLSLSYSYVANRVSYSLNFHGPSLAVDTLCSASLTAVHMAVESIRRGECEAAIAGGVNLTLHPGKYKTFGMANMHSSDGYCRTFGKDGDGFTSGEGIGAVVLKPLSAAVKDGDQIYAVIKGSSINHVGAVSGITVPSPVAQAELIEDCLNKVNIHPRTISYLEAHGTGTSLGDPIEIQGLVKAYSRYTDDRQYCAIGSVKSNVGHGESAAGVCGLIKVALQMHHKTLVPSLHSAETNPYIDFEQSPFYIQRKIEQWEQPRVTEAGKETVYPRRAGISSFGAYGSNAHIILEEWVPQPPSASGEPSAVIVPLSAKNEDRLKAYADRLARFLADEAGCVASIKEMESQSGLAANILRMVSTILKVDEQDIDFDQDWSEYGMETAHLSAVREQLLREYEIETDSIDWYELRSISDAAESLHLILNRNRHVEGGASQEMSLSSIAYTLQTGREAMEVRVVFLVSSIRELTEKMRAYADGKPSIPNCWRGQLKKKSGVSAEVAKADDHWFTEGNMAEIAQSWAQGSDIEWGRLYRTDKPRKMHLPAYPFAKNRYWLPVAPKPQDSLPTAVQQVGGTAKAANPTSPQGESSAVIPASNRNAENDANQRIVEADTGAGLQDMLRQFTPVWDTFAVEPEGDCFPAVTERIAVFGLCNERFAQIQALYPGSVHFGNDEDISVDDIKRKISGIEDIGHFIWVVRDPAAIDGGVDDALITAHNQTTLSCFRFIQSLLQSGYGSRSVGLTVITTQAQAVSKKDSIKPAQAGVHGLIGSLAKEYPNWMIRLIDLESDSIWPVAEMFRIPADRKGGATVYRGREWHRMQLIPTILPAPKAPVYRNGGVYVVIGGAGGIGMVWSEYMIRTYQAQIVWIGRSPMNDAIRTKIHSLSDRGPEIRYWSADASDIHSLSQAYAEIKQRFGSVNGVVHSAMVLNEYSLAEMDEVALQAALSAKVDVSVRMAQVFREERLDFVLFFSSLISLIKNPQQAHYAAGCVFKDAFAHLLAQQWSCSVKVLNWGFWSSDKVEDTEKYRLLQELGIGLIEPEEGMQAIERVLAQPQLQLAVMKTTKPIPVESMNPKEEMKALAAGQRSVETGRSLPAASERPELGQLKRENAEKTDEMNGLLGRLLFVQLRQTGVFASGTFDLKQAMAVSGIDEKMYAEWLNQSVTILVELGLLSRSGNLLSVTAKASTDHRTVWEQWGRHTAKWREDEKTRAQIVLVETTLKSLPAVLTGKSAATDVLFPNSSMELVEGIYKSNPVADYFNDVVAEAALHVVRQCVQENPKAQIRILEIGAGTGGTSAGVLAKLAVYKTHIAEYCYTDLSKMFLLHAQKEYGPSYPFLTYRTFNVEQALAQQGVDAGQYDLVIAANVLHATRNMRTTVRNAKAALKPGGWLLLNEISNGALFTHLTFGLLEGWWLYDDPGIRIPGSPALSPESWQQLLEREGFGAIGFLAQDHHDLGQQIVAAQSDGIIRQPRWEQRKGISAQQSATQSVSTLTNERNDAANADSRRESEDSLFALNEQMLQDEIKSLIASQLAETLKLDASSLDMDDSFADYGLDSISGVHIVNTLNERLQIEMKTTILFDYSSINQLAGYLLSAHKEAVVSAFSDRLAAFYEQGSISLEREEQAVHFESLQTKASAQPAEAAVSVRAEEAAVKEPIAIIGMSGRFAKSNTLDELWDHLAQGHDLVEEVTRWDLSKYAPKGKPYCNHGSFLDEIDKFDPSFFNISGLEATYMDPQQRMFLEESWKALEDSGYAGQSVEGRACGVYVGYNIGDYVHHIGDNSPPQAMWGNAPSIIPARIAYYLNLQGPAVTVDTACSSSLVSIHLACQGLWTGETEMALAGGVFVQTTPTFYINSNRAGMLSPTGKCHTFDNRADGFVPGEGVGVVVLKRLKDAIADGDHIHGVIKGSGINQDGTTNGITAPSANSQERLEKSVYDRFAIHPEQIQMVEAHGTGTRLGDPIEFEALNSAFSHYTDKKQFCAIGTIKTNIGHTTAAAGVASVFKILLSLRNQQIPPSLHYETGNAHIKFSSSPFYVNTEIKNWAVPPGSRRIAATSSFGFSGTNAHMVIEEAPAPVRMHTSRPFYLITLSARSGEQLKQQAERLLEHCERVPGIDAGNISYTLLVGRRHMNHRLACIVKDAEELKQLLSNWLSRGKMAQVYVSELAENDVREQQSLKRFGNAAIESCQTCTNPGLYLEHLSTAAELYVQGYALNYSQLFAGDSYSRVPLPTYPFAKERYWVSNTDYPPQDPQRREPMKASSKSLPLNLQRASLMDTSGLLFQTVLTGTEFFLTDHSVRGRKVLPAVTYLEMARAAVTAACEKGSGTPTSPVLLRHIGWVQPIVVEDRSVTVNIHLQRNSEADFFFEIYTEASGHPAGRTVHCQGTAALDESVQVPHIELLEELQARCDGGLITGAQCYDMLGRLDMDYGPGHRAIDRIQVGKGELLGRLEIAASALSTLEHYVLHPGMIDSALQASIGMAALPLDSEGGTGSEAALRPGLPYALDRLVILGPSTAVMWAWIRRSSGSTATGAIQKLDIDIYDEHGKHCAILQGLSSRQLEAEVEVAMTMEEDAPLLWNPAWAERNDEDRSEARIITRRYMYLLEENQSMNPQLARAFPEASCKVLKAEGQVIEERYVGYAEQLMVDIQKILKDKLGGQSLIQLLIPASGEQQLYAGLAGMLKTAHLENPNVWCQLIEFDAGVSSEQLLSFLEIDGRHPSVSHIRYEGSRRYEAVIEGLNASDVAVDAPWKDRGVYLITGGAGGLGLIFAQDIARKSREAAIILTGRSELDPNRQSQLEMIRELGAHVEYHTADVRKESDMAALMSGIVARHGRLNGILHAAGMKKDSFLIHKTTDDLIAVLGPKVDGLIALDKATSGLELDFFVLFSSLSGCLGNYGQADYAAANGFMDAFAAYRNELVAAGHRQGHTLSVNWPLWQEGGMTVDPATEAMMEQRSGMKAIQSQQGIQALYAALASGKHQVAVMNMALRTPPLMEELATAQQAPAAEWQSDRDNPLGPDELYERTMHYLRETLSSYIRIPLHRMDAKTSFSKFGIDSIMAMQLTAQLENELGSLPKTLFFEYETIQALCEYLIAHYEPKLRRVLAPELTQVIPKAASPVIAAAPLSVTPAPVATKPALKQATLIREEISERQPASDIAIIGLSGRYPGADDLDQFWDNLKSGKDCIEEIPAVRWQSGKYYDPEKGKPGKSYCQWGGFLKDIDQFDPIFFQLSPLEASYISPQERLFLESVWNTLEQAGYTSQTLEHEYGSKVGVYAGCMYNHYHLLNNDPAKEPLFALSSYSSIANRVSHFFNFKGPSIAVDTMCSSSAVAIHMACESLRKGECELAIAGGVNLSLHPQKYVGLSMSRLAGSHPGSRSFADGDGYLPAEGVGSVLLKPLVKAIEDGDSILAVIKSTAVNHGGQTNGYGAPNPNAQAQLMEESMRQADIKPESISYIECAANGSSIGDAVEMAAMNKVYRSHSGMKRALPIGSVKSNIGHGEAASGIAQLTKVVLQLKHRQLVPTLGSDTALNPNLRLEETNFRIQRHLEDWQQTENEAPHGGKFPLRAAISSFGAGGTNAHLIVEEYVPPAEEPSVQETGNQLVILSAKSRERLKEAVYHVRQYVKRNEELSLDDLAYTLQVGRESMDFRLAVTASSREELMAALSYYLGDTGSSDIPLSGSFGLYEGNAGGPPDDMLRLLSGKNGKLYLKHLMDELDVEKLAIYWSKGGDMDWRELYRSRRKGRIVPLLTYPFVKQRCWLEIQPEAGLERTEAEMGKNDEMSVQKAQLAMNGNDAKTIVLNSVALLLGVMPTEIQTDKRLMYYGLSSLHLAQLLAGLQKVAAPSMELPDLLTCETIQDLIDKVQANFPPEIDDLHADGSFLEENFKQQIIRLNPITDGRPVFWIHGAFGSVEVYRSLAAYAKRPFYGIQSFGGTTDESPEGIVAIASQYVRLIQAIQPEGPYDLGGYSLGGMLAYEMTRQLQEAGETVSSLVMLDTMFSPEVQRTTLDQNSIALQTVNMALAAVHGIASTDEKGLLIHRDEIDCDNGFDVFFERLTELAEHRGLDIPKRLLEKQFESQFSMQQRYRLIDYKLLPLPRPDEVTCYYFRNQSGVFMGSWEPYLTAKEGAVPFDHLPYWEEWVRQIPQAYVMDVEASTHMTMLEDEAARQTIYAFCEKLYGKRPLSARFFQSFYKQHAMFV